MNKYFTIILTTIITSITVTSSADASSPCGDNDDVCWDAFYAIAKTDTGTVTSDLIPTPCGDNDDVCWDDFYGNGGTVSPDGYRKKPNPVSSN